MNKKNGSSKKGRRGNKNDDDSLILFGKQDFERLGVPVTDEELRALLPPTSDQAELARADVEAFERAKNRILPFLREERKQQRELGMSAEGGLR